MNKHPTTKKKHAKRKVLGLDFDDVLINFNDALQDYHNKRYGTEVERHMLTDFDIYSKLWQCTPEEAAVRAYQFMGSQAHDMTPPLDGAVAALKRLLPAFDMHVITSRREQVRGIVMKWLDTHFPGHFRSVVLTNQYFGDPDKMRSKVEVCREKKVDVMVEDSISQVRQLAPIVEKVFLIDCPWNQGELPANVTRVYSWAEIADALL